MSPTRAQFVTVCLVTAMVLGPRSSSAQSLNPSAHLTVLVPHLAGQLVCDVAMILSLSNSGTARRGFSITGLVFSGVGALLSVTFLLLDLGLSSSATLPISASSLAFSLGSGVLSFYGLFHPPLEPVAPPPRSVDAPLDQGEGGAPTPQLDTLPIRVSPYWRITPRGDLEGGGMLRLRW